APRILELLDAGGTVAAFAGGEPVPEFLPGVRWQHRPTNFWWWSVVSSPAASSAHASGSGDVASFGAAGLSGAQLQALGGLRE
ncbi:MAG: hypothetical protein JWQ60_1909, partial [Pseudonocardia sp.]|nr:hypothetical protein [Pseudonocardia sp.]